MPQNFSTRIVDTLIFMAIVSFIRSSDAYLLSASIGSALCQEFCKSKVKICSLLMLTGERWKWLIQWCTSEPSTQSLSILDSLPSSTHLCMLESSGLVPGFLLYPRFFATWSYAELQHLNAGDFQSYTFRPDLALRSRLIHTYHLYLGDSWHPRLHNQTYFSLLFQ